MPLNSTSIIDGDYKLARPKNEQDWQDYHRIRREVLFESRGRKGIYDANRPEEYAEGHTSLLLKFKNRPIGTVRLDHTSIRRHGKNTFIVRLVAIDTNDQGQGHGKKLEEMTTQYAQNLGAEHLLVNAVHTAYDYYKKSGWTDYQWSEEEENISFEPVTQMEKAV
jgi:predicted N-acetyltransferase YhbS